MALDTPKDTIFTLLRRQGERVGEKNTTNHSKRVRNESTAVLFDITLMHAELLPRTTPVRLQFASVSVQTSICSDGQGANMDVASMKL